MSWSDDMRCLYCDGKLPLYRKITSGQFCSAGHRKSYWQEQERLAVERLHQTHDSLRAYRPPEDIESPLGNSPFSKVSPSDPLPSGHIYAAAVDDVIEAHETPLYQETGHYADLARKASNTGDVTFAGFLTEARPTPRVDRRFLFGITIDIGAPLDLATPLDLAAMIDSDGFWMPPYGAAAGELAWGQRVALSLFDPAIFAPAVSRSVTESAAFGARPIIKVNFAATPETVEFQPEFLQRLAEAAPAAAQPEIEPEVEPYPALAEEPGVPFAESLFALPRIAARAAEMIPRMQQPETVHAQTGPQMTSRESRFAALAVCQSTALLPLLWDSAPRTWQAAPRVGAPQTDLAVSAGAPRMMAHVPVIEPMLNFAPGCRYPMSSGPSSWVDGNSLGVDSARPVDLRAESAAAQWEQPVRDLKPSLGMAPGCRYPVAIQASQMSVGTLRAIAAQPEELSRKIQIVPLRESQGAADPAPAFRGMLPLEFHATPRTPDAAQPFASGILNQYPANAPMLPVSRLQPIEGDSVAPARKGFLAGWTPALAGSREGTNILTQAADFWQHAPRDFKLLAVAIPILLGLALRPSLPKVRITAPASSTQIQGSLERGIYAQLKNVRRTVSERAGVALSEEFRSGLDDWQSRGDLSTAWSFDNSGFVRPGSLALYRPSMGLTNYELQFLGMIDKKALSWVVRAADFDNYYVIKLVVTKPGPLPTIGITRYAVVNGKPQDRIDTVAAINARPDTLYRVNLTVNGSNYLLALQGIVVDNWTETRLKNGGVGFFSPRGEASRLRWVQVTHQYDMLGRLCAYLAPYDIQNTNGSW